MRYEELPEKAWERHHYIDDENVPAGVVCRVFYGTVHRDFFGEDRKPHYEEPLQSLFTNVESSRANFQLVWGRDQLLSPQKLVNAVIAARHAVLCRARQWETDNPPPNREDRRAYWDYSIKRKQAAGFVDVTLDEVV